MAVKASVASFGVAFAAVNVRVAVAPVALLTVHVSIVDENEDGCTAVDGKDGGTVCEASTNVQKRRRPKTT